MEIPPNYGKRYTSMFRESYRDLANEYNIELVPFFLQNIATDSTLMLKDGIHPNAQAQVIIAETMQHQLGEIIFP
jgi:acyl-CoA thioesterase-1